MNLSITQPDTHTGIVILGSNSFVDDSIRKTLQGTNDYTVGYVNRDKKLDDICMQLVEPRLLIISCQYAQYTGWQKAQELRSHHPQLLLIAYSRFYHPYQVFRMLDAGARAFLSLDHTAAQWLEAVDTVMRGYIYYNSCLQRSDLEYYGENRHDPFACWKQKMTGRDIEIAEMLLDEKSQLEILDHFGIPETQRSSFFQSMYGRLGVKTHTGMIKLAIAEGHFCS